MGTTDHRFDPEPQPYWDSVQAATSAAVGPPAVRVLCPDGAVVEEFTGDPGEESTVALEHWARLAAANADDMHDGARCTGPHRIERATWAEVPR